MINFDHVLNLSSSNKNENSTDSADHATKPETVRTKQQPSKYRLIPSRFNARQQEQVEKFPTFPIP